MDEKQLHKIRKKKQILYTQKKARRMNKNKQKYDREHSFMVEESQIIHTIKTKTKKLYK